MDSVNVCLCVLLMLSVLRMLWLLRLLHIDGRIMVTATMPNNGNDKITEFQFKESSC